MKKKVIIIEDDIVYATILKKWFDKNEFCSTMVSTLTSAKEKISEDRPSIILSDLRLPDGNGVELLEWMRTQNINIPFLTMTSYAEISSAVNAMKLGAEDFLEKPIVPSVLKEKIGKILRGESNIQQETTKKVEKENRVFGTSPNAKKIHDYISKVAPTKMTVLITGESGTGKEYAARLIHDKSNRKNEQFVAVDCGALSKDLATSELFGHIKGAFTSAIEDKKGVFEIASGGTLFLDEIGNLSYEVQVQLLRALQEKKIKPVGASKDIDVDVRIIVATNEDLTLAIEEGKFREDLYHRLDEFSLDLPPLRNCLDDIKKYSEEFLLQSNIELEKNIKGFSDDVLDKLKKYSWPGNLRELKNVIRKAVLFSNSEFINSEDIPELHEKNKQTKIQNNIIEDTLTEKEKIINAIKQAKGNKSKAAIFLEIDRKTLYNKIHQYGIEL